jgi:hypothetical protein
MNDRNDLPKLRQQVHDSRIRLAREYSGLVGELDVPRRFARSVRNHPLGWVGGAAAAGLILTLFGRRSTPASRPSPKRGETFREPAPTTLSRAGLLAGALQVGRLLYPVLRPVILEYAGKAARAGLDRVRRR